jgi:hypothetical protein
MSSKSIDGDDQIELRNYSGESQYAVAKIGRIAQLI